MTDAGAAKRVLVVGEINVDLICQGYHAFPTPGREVLVDDFQMVLGSASAICAMGLARLGTPVAFLGKVGTDPWGDFCLDAMRGAGIDVAEGTGGETPLEDGELTLIDALTGQLLAFFRCLDGGGRPDSPSSGAIRRVVESFAIHDGRP